MKFEQKYNMKASEFYRKKLKAELNNEKLMEKEPEISEGIKFKNFENNKDLSIFKFYLRLKLIFIDIDNSNLICSLNNPNENNDKFEDQEQRGCLNKISNMFFYTTDSIKSYGYDIYVI